MSKAEEMYSDWRFVMSEHGRRFVLWEQMSENEKLPWIELASKYQKIS